MTLALAWVWKSNQVKEYYSIMRKLETEKMNLISENTRLRANLMDLKSLSQVDLVVTTKFGLTQDVSRRIFFDDPVKTEKKNRANFAAEPEIPGWLEDAVIGSGRVRAESRRDKGGGR